MGKKKIRIYINNKKIEKELDTNSLLIKIKEELLDNILFHLFF